MEDDQSKIIFENICNFKSKDPILVLNSIKQMNKITEALGPERTVKELLPFLRDLLEEDPSIVLPLLDSVSNLDLDYSKRISNVDDKETFQSVAYFFDEAAGFQERSVRNQSAVSINNLFGKANSSIFRILVLNFISKLKNSSNLEKRLVLSKVLARAGETLRSSDENFSNVQ
jgi:hypothetical protein